MIPKTGLGVEIGAGTGVFAEALTTESRLILCVDPSGEMLKKAKQRGLPCILGVGDNIPLRKRLIGFNYMITVLEFLNNPVKIFREIRANSRENASLSVLFINSESSWGDLYRDIGAKGDPVFQHARLYSLMEVSAMFETAGYKISSVKGTLNSHPMNQNVDTELVEPSSVSGVIIISGE